MKTRVRETRRHHHNSPHREQRPRHRPANDLPLRPHERHRKPVRKRGERRRRGGRWREEGGGDGEDVEAAVEGYGGCGGVAEGDVGDGSGAGEDAEAGVAAAGEAGNGFDDVDAAGDLEDVGAHGGFGGLAGDDEGWLGLVLGARGAAPGAAAHLNGCSVAGARFLGGALPSLFGCLAFSQIVPLHLDPGL